MIISLRSIELKNYIANQLDFLYPDGYRLKGKDVDTAFELALDRVENCFKHITLRGYRNENKEACFSHLHSDQYSQFLYFFSNSLWNVSQNSKLCSKLINLNKALNGMFYSYKCKLPDIFLFAHPVGSIIGNASYSDGLVIFQNVTINTGNDLGGIDTTPKLGKGLFLGAGAKIIGEKPIGNRVSIGVDAMVYNKEISDDIVVIRDSETDKMLFKPRKKRSCMAQNYFDIQL